MPPSPIDSTATPVEPDELIVVHKSGRLNGRVVVPGAKNSVLKLMAATLMADGEYVLSNVPDIADVEIMSDLLAAIGVRTLREPQLDGEGCTEVLR